MKNENISIGLISGTNLEEAKKELISFVSGFDGDLGGENGKEYTSEEALKSGYDSTIEFWVNESDQTEVKPLIEEIMKGVTETYYSYDFAGYNLESLPNNDYIVVFACS
jgi:hypothetical protein